MKLLVLLFILPINFLLAQSIELQVASEKFYNKIDYHEGKILEIDGTHAHINIVEISGSEIKINIKLVAKHPEKKVAIESLEKLGYWIEENGNKILLKNIIFDNPDDIPAQLITYFDVQIPKGCPVILKNYFGESLLRDLDTNIDIFTEFTTLNIEKIKGHLDIVAAYGDIFGNDISGRLEIESNFTNMLLSKLFGSVDLNTKFGKVEILGNNSYANINIVGENTDIYFIEPDIERFNYNIAVQDGELIVPEFVKEHLMSDASIRTMMFTPNKEIPNFEVTVKSHFGNVKILKKKEGF